MGIGASAGGLESLERFFTHLPADSGMAFVVLQHLSPDFKSFMNELLSRRTRMTIRQAEHDMVVEPNTVYLLPPMKEMIIRRHRLLLNDRDPRSGLTLPIDLFLRSLAHDLGERTVAVILSGSGSDGSRGLREVSQAGGTVFCESPDSAQFNGMPLSAIRTGNVDRVLPPEELAAAVAALAANDPAALLPPGPASEERGVEAILRLLRDEYALDFSHYKASTVTRRIERRLALNRSLDIDMYVEQVRSDPRELSSLYEDLLIGVTRFFRDDAAFDVLEHRIIPEIVERTNQEDQIRVWVPGCATGQEAYSIAMLFYERLNARRRPVNLKLLATDVRAPTSWVMSREMPETPTIALALSWIGENVTDTSTRAPSLRKCVVSNRSGGRPSRTCRTIVSISSLRPGGYRKLACRPTVLPGVGELVFQRMNLILGQTVDRRVRLRLGEDPRGDVGEGEIADREERIRLLLDSTAEAIYGIDLSGRCIFCNAACARLLGYPSPAALVGKQMHPLIHHTRPDGTPYAPEQSPIYQAMRHREGAHVQDEVLWRADGTSFPAEYWSHPILQQNDVIGAVVTFLDVTERRKAEQEIQDGVRRRGQFLAMLSHELRNPLAAILSATHVLESASWTDDACHEAGQVVTRQANHMARLLDDLLDVARITRGRIVLRKESVDLRDTARLAIEALGPLMAERGTRLVTEIGDQPVPVFGDPARLQQVQANLLSNASTYSPVGGRVWFELRRDRDEAIIRVSDEGRGIDRDILPKIFDLFVQGHRTIARSEGGLGIGLTLLRSLVELHDGCVEADSDGPERGSVFTVRLPLEGPKARPAAAAVLEDWPKCGRSCWSRISPTRAG